MSPIHETELRKFAGAALDGGVVDTHRACGNCGYDLFGLKLGGRCPECGQAIRGNRSGDGKLRDTLLEAPREYLLKLRTGSIALMASGAPLTLLVLFYGWMWDSRGPAYLFTGLSVLWAFGVWRVTMPRGRTPAMKIDPAREFGTLRWISRGSQLAWLAFGLCWLVNAAAAAKNPVGSLAIPEIVTSLLYTIGVLGFVGVCWQGAHLAEWSSDDDLAGILRNVAWGLPISGAVIMGLGFVPVTTQVMCGGLFVIPAARLLFAACGAYFLYCQYRLASNAAWAIRNVDHAKERELRLIEKAEAQRLEQEAAREQSARAEPAAARGGGASAAMAHRGAQPRPGAAPAAQPRPSAAAAQKPEPPASPTQGLQPRAEPEIYGVEEP